MPAPGIDLFWSPEYREGLASVPLALFAARALQHQLCGVSPFNLPALAAAAAVVGGCALIASASPARRTTSIAPKEALRME